MSALYENQPNIVQDLRQGLIRPERGGEYWTDDERELLRRSFEEGVSVTDLAIQLHRSEPAIMQQIEKQDLYGRKANPQRRKNVKEHVCLCSSCRAPEGLCPRLQRQCGDTEVCTYG